MDVDIPQTPVGRGFNPQYEQPPLTPLMLDISGDPEPPTPEPGAGYRCACCGIWTEKLWQGSRAGFVQPHAVCTLCYLVGHLDSPTAMHGCLAYLPGMSLNNVQHLQRRVLVSLLGGNKLQRREAARIARWLWGHTREVEQAWGTARAADFAVSLKRLPPQKRVTLQTRLKDCALLLPMDLFDDFALLLPAGKTIEAALTSRSWDTYTRSDLYVEPDTLG